MELRSILKRKKFIQSRNVFYVNSHFKHLMKRPKLVRIDLDKPITELVSNTDHRTLGIWAADCAERVLPYFEEKYPGDDGYIYGPNRKHTRRMAAIKGQLALSNDPLWNEIGKLH